MTTNTPAVVATVTAPPFDYQAELDRISNEIETNLKQQFEALFAQLESKLDTFMKRCTDQKADQDLFMKKCSKQKADQDLFNEKVTKQLNYLVDNMKCFVKLANPTVNVSLPLPGSGDGMA